MICSACGAANGEGAKFCGECGSALSLACPSCGSAYVAAQKFCHECGRPLGAGARAVDGPGGGVGTAAGARAGVPAVGIGAPEATPPGAALGEAELRFVSVLFVDLVGFTTLSEGREAEDVRELLGSYFTAASAVVERYGGLVEKFIGDAVMAVWGARQSDEDDGERAVRAALEIVEAVEVLGEQERAPGLRARAGVVTGQVAALERAAQGIVVGDRVNTASRVQSAAPPGGVLVDEVTRQVSAAAIDFADAGDHTLKGKAEPVRLWRALRAVSGRGGRFRTDLEPPFVGRDAELRFLKDAVHATVERRSARLVVVSGEAGLGKSRLRRELERYMDGLADSFLWHEGRCLSHNNSVAFWALAEMVRRRLGIPEDATAEQTTEKLGSGLQRWLPNPADRAYVLPRLAVLLGVGEASLAGEELLAGWRLFFERLAEDSPVVMVFDDMQWADPGLLGFVEQLLDWATSVPILMVVLTRPELIESGWPVGRRGASSLALEPLSDRAIEMLVSGLVDGLSAVAVSRIVAQAQGVPLFAVETVRSLIDRDLITEQAGRFTAGSQLDGGELEVPASLQALLSSRLDALDAEALAVVKAMAVYGGSFPRSAAAALAAVPENHLDDCLRSLVRKQVLLIRADPLSPDRGQYVFAQDLLRVAAYERLARRERVTRHTAAARHLRAAFANSGEEVAEVIASHLLAAFRAAGQDPEAASLRTETVSALRVAGERSAALGATEAAERSYRTAAELSPAGDRSTFIRAAGEMALLAGRLESAVELLDEAVGLYDAAGDTAAAAAATAPLGVALRDLDRAAEAEARLRVRLETLADDDRESGVEAVLQLALARALWSQGEIDRGLVAVEVALGIAQALELPALVVEALATRGTLLIYVNRAAEAGMHLREAIVLAERHEVPDQYERANNNAGHLSIVFDLPDARELTETALAVARRRGSRTVEAMAGSNLMALELLAGRWPQIEAMAADLVASGRDVHVHAGLAALYALRGEADSAREVADGLAIWENTDDVDSKGLAATGVVAAAYAAGRVEEALERALAIVTPELSLESLRELWPWALDAALEIGRHDEASRLLAMLAERPPGHVPPYLRAHLARGRALLASRRARLEDGPGDLTDTVESDLRDAAARFATLEYPYWLAVTRVDLADWLAAQDRGTEATELLEAAIEVLERLEARPVLERARAIARRVPAGLVSATERPSGSRPLG